MPSVKKKKTKEQLIIVKLIVTRKPNDTKLQHILTLFATWVISNLSSYIWSIDEYI